MKSNPAAIISFSFLSVILAGMFLLKMPGATDPLYSLSWLDALFMSTSSVCVTGLATLNVGQDLTPFGQGILLLLMQLGGLGIMTFSLFFSLLLGRKTTLTSRLSLGSISREHDAYSLLHSLGFVFLMTISFEALGTLVLFLELQKFHPVGYALFSAAFHSVAAFCNAGLSLYPDNLEGFQNNYIVMSVIMVLIVAGGLGFTVIEEMRAFLISRFQKNKRFTWSLHSKVVLSATFFLLIIGTAAIWLFESRNTLAGQEAPFQFMNALFLSVTSRTAGFNTLATGNLTEATLFFVVFLMFIGGASGSTAGGIKVGTFSVLAALIWHQIKGSGFVILFRRKVPLTVVGQSLAIFGASFLLIQFSSLLLAVTECRGEPHGEGTSLLSFLFETTSAFGTVGLSTGITEQLTAAGKWVIILLMFLGRVGPLTVGIAILTQKRKPLSYEYAEEEVIIG